jgi:amino acid transporter
VVFGALAGLTSVVLVLILGQARILLAMSRDGLLPPALGRVHPTFRTPHVATAITGVAAALMAGLFPIGLLAELVSIGTLLAFVMVCGSVLVLRRIQSARSARRSCRSCLAGVARAAADLGLPSTPGRSSGCCRLRDLAYGRDTQLGRR